MQQIKRVAGHVGAAIGWTVAGAIGLYIFIVLPFVAQVQLNHSVAVSFCDGGNDPKYCQQARAIEADRLGAYILTIKF